MFIICSICAVHGLSANAFDTWIADNGKMWLRDFLIEDSSFAKSRIMTFGYDAGLLSSHKLDDGLQTYADTLLRELILLRECESGIRKPILFICHSMGGLVVRRAMTRLQVVPKKFPDIDLSLCALLFLSTPHLGSAEADWNDFFVAIGAVFGLRDELVKELKSFNPSSSDSVDSFKEMKQVPLIDCLCEGEKTFAKGKYRTVGISMMV